jgi:hypothetical protein
MSDSKLEFLTMMMNDPGMRQRNRNAQDRRRACEALWDEKQAAVADAEPEPEPEPETETVTETETPDAAGDDDPALIHGDGDGEDDAEGEATQADDPPA